MKNLLLSFSFKNERFCLCVTEKGTSKRNYKEVQGLTNPDFKTWNKKEQQFKVATYEAINNNNVLREIRERYQLLIDTFNPLSGKELFQLCETSAKVEANKVLTLGGYLESLIIGMRNERNKKPSGNYHNYTDLLHKLEKEGKIINTPLSDIDNKCFIEFGKWLLALHEKTGKSNYINNMKWFKTTHTKAREHELNSNVLKYKFMNYAPTIETKEKKALTTRLYDKFLKLDLTRIPQPGCNPLYYLELYHDYCIFLYEMKMRPVDVIRLHNDNITSINGKTYISHIPEKKKNCRKSKSVRNEITETAQRIIDKYKGNSSQGYIFPFAMNEYKWDMKNADSWNRWNNRKKSTEEKINKFLKKAAPFIGVSPDDFTLYTFRRSTITHEIEANKKSPARIAAEAGTSVAMIEKHYFDITA